MAAANNKAKFNDEEVKSTQSRAEQSVFKIDRFIKNHLLLCGLQCSICSASRVMRCRGALKQLWRWLWLWLWLLFLLLLCCPRPP